MTKGLCWIDLTGELKVTVRNVEIDAEVTADLDAKDLSNILIADVLKFDLSWKLDYLQDFEIDFRNDAGILDALTWLGVGFFELLTGEISKQINEAEETLKNKIRDMIPFCAKFDDKCKIEGQL